MIDWHSHILPGMDDGSKNVEESISLINMQMAQGVDVAVATPHFLANDETVDAFLERRRESLHLLKKAFPDNSVKIIPGAEVKYYPGISRMDNLGALRIEGTTLLLLEMPFSQWSESTVRELIEMAGKGNIQIVLAHFERYLTFQSQGVWERIFEAGILIQSNASFFTSFITKRKALSFLRRYRIHFIGSDCHNTVSRPPQIGKAFEYIQKKLGNDYLYQLDNQGRSLLKINNK